MGTSEYYRVLVSTLEYSGVLVRGWLKLDSSRTLEALEIP